MNIEQINLFNSHLANTFEQYKPLKKFSSSFDYESSKNYYTKSNSSTSSNLNLETEDDYENSTDTNFTSETNASFNSKLNDKDFKNLNAKILSQETSILKKKPKRLSYEFRERKNHNPLKRNAANKRERLRMQSIKEAFETLKERIPKSVHEKRLSKVDTLKLAINYISYLNEMIITGRSPTENAAIRKNQEKSQKKVLQYFRDENGIPLTTHLLSWKRENSPFQNGDIVLAKIWTPEDPRTKTNNNLANKKESPSCDEDDCSKNFSQSSTSNDTNSNFSYNNTSDCQNNFLFQNDNYSIQSNCVDSSTMICYTSNNENNFVEKNSLKNQQNSNFNQLNKMTEINQCISDMCLQENNQLVFNSSFNTQNFSQTINSQQNYINHTDNEFVNSINFSNSICSNENQPFVSNYSNYNNQSFNQIQNHNAFHHNIENIPSKVFQNDISNQIICYNNIVQNSSSLIYNVE